MEYVTFEEMQKMLADEDTQQSQKAGASSCSMCNDTNWWRNRNEEVCKQNPTRIASYAKKTSNQADGLSSVQLMKKSGVGG